MSEDDDEYFQRETGECAAHFAASNYVEFGKEKGMEILESPRGTADIWM